MENQIILAAKNIFGLTEDEARDKLSLLRSAAIMLVEYDRLLPGENKREYDTRRENISVYTGDIKALVKYLTKMDKRVSNGLLPWEIIFTYVKKINPDFISGSKHEEIASSPEDKSVVKNSQGTDAEQPTQVIENNGSGEIAATLVETPTEEARTPSEEETPKVIIAETRETDVVGANTQQVTAKCDTSLEVHKMSETTGMSLEELAGQISGENTEVKEAIENAQAQGEGAKKSSKPIKVDRDIQSDISAAFQNTVAERNAFVRDTHINEMIATAPSIKERLTVSENIHGKLADPGTATDPQKAVGEKVAKKLAGIVAKATGKADMTYEKFATLSEEDKYANCVTDEDKAMAKKIVELLVQAQTNPNMDVALAAPAEKNVAYKGLVIGGVKYPKDEITALIIDKANDAIFGEGMLDAEGKRTELSKNAETNIEVRISVKKTTKSADTTEITTATTTATYRPTTVLKGRKALVDQGKVTYIFPDINKEVKKTASLTVLIDGKPATFKYFRRDEKGNKKFVGTGEKAHYMTQTASLKGCGTVYDVIKEMPAEYVGSDSRKEASDRWGVRLPKVENDSAFVTDFDESKVFELLTIANTNFAGIKSTSQTKVAEILKRKKAADAADASDSLDV